jgi:EAL domain-containing protein (putative c-di-GMP-specific phosphodiesterase class I)/ActR/RegA family two-component response regulator
LRETGESDQNVPACDVYFEFAQGQITMLDNLAALSPSSFRIPPGPQSNWSTAPRVPAVTPPSKISISNLNFLVVEDQSVQRTVLVTMLRNLGAKTVGEASDGHSGLDIIQNASPMIDIAIIDLHMPGMDGMELIRHLSHSRAAVSIILASALERPLIAAVEKMTAAYGLTLLGSLQKPATTDELRSLISRHHPGGASADDESDSYRRLSHFTRQELVAALNNEEFEPFFQPKIQLATGEVAGAEALARWRHPKLGIVAPYAFIGVMEEEGLIDDLTWLMLRKGGAMCRHCRAAGIEITISVNLSLSSLNHQGLADFVTDIVHSSDVEPVNIVLEVTETSAMSHSPAVLENLARLRMRGFGLSIDDYGTGYSSMQRLSHIAFTELKIDQSFVKNSADDHASRIILESSIDMAKKLNMAAVAEGVETKADWSLLSALGCDFGQGHLFAKPMDAEHYMHWVGTH